MKALTLSLLVALSFLFSNFAWATSVTCSFGSESIHSKLYDSGSIELPEDGTKIHVFAVYKNGSILYLNEKEYMNSGLDLHSGVSIDITKDGIRYSGWNRLDGVKGDGYVPFVLNKDGQYKASPSQYVDKYFIGNSLGLKCVQAELEPTQALPSQFLNRKFKVVGCNGSYKPSGEALFLHNPIKVGSTIEMVSFNFGSTIFEINSNIVELPSFYVFGKSGYGREQSNARSHQGPSGFDYFYDYLLETSSQYREDRSRIAFVPNTANTQKWQLSTSTYSDHNKKSSFLRASAICDLEEVL